MVKASRDIINVTRLRGKSAKRTVLENAANELIFAVVGHVGSGTTAVARTLASLLEDASAIGDVYDVSYIKATDLIRTWATEQSKPIPEFTNGQPKSISYVTGFQDLGDAMRQESDDNAAVAKAFSIEIRQKRAQKLSITLSPGEAVPPDGARRAYILDSIRHPAEVHLLRHIYQDAFVLVGVVCESDTRQQRVSLKCKDATPQQVDSLMSRDEKSVAKFGQRVANAFHLSDFFIDNTPNRHNRDGAPNPAWEVAEQLSRLVRIIRQQDVVRPESGETAMWYAHGAAMRSACLSRQVGAALLDRQGNIVATGTNEVPKAGGGVYGEGFPQSDIPDHRCAHREVSGRRPFCSNTQEREIIIGELLDSISRIKPVNEKERDEIKSLFRDGRVGDLLEFSRAVHAEMDAILTAGRKGVTTFGTRLFVTTFPCHYCARHIVSAGIDEVQYIEPYPKSRALRLHSDSVQITAEEWTLPSSQRVVSLLPTDSGRRPSNEAPKVLFRPFTGVAPRLYRRAFLKEGDLKDSVTGDMAVSPPEWGTPWHLRRLSYAELEAKLAQETGR